MRKPRDPRLAVRDTVSFETVLDHLYALFRDAGYGRAFDPFERIRAQRAQVTDKVERDLAARAEGLDRYAPLRQLTAQGLAVLLRQTTGIGALLPQEATERALNVVLQAGAENLAHLRGLAEEWLRSRLKPEEYDLFLLPHEALARAFAQGVRAVARRKPLILVLDTYEIADRADPWLRLVIRQSGPCAVWVLSGRDNLAESRRYGRDYFLGYQGQVPGERLRVFPLGEFSVADVAAYFAERVPDRPLESGQDEAIHRATYGIPLAVKEAAAIWAAGTSLSAIVEGIPDRAPRERIVRVMTERLLVHCLNVPEDRERLYTLALAYHPDYDLLAAMMDVDDLGPVLSDLERRYDFVFAREMTLYEAVRSFLREYLLAEVERRRPAVREANQRAVAHLEARLQGREQHLPTLEARVEDERWAADTLALVYHRFWLDEEAGWSTLLASLPAGLAYDRDFARALLEAAEPLSPTWTRSGRRRLKALRAGLTWLADADEEAALLMELEQAARRGWPDDGCAAERDAILSWLRGRLAHRRNNHRQALEHYLAAEVLEPEAAERLRDKLAEGFEEIGDRLAWKREGWEIVDALPSQEASLALSKAIALGRESASLYHTLGAVELKLGDLENSLAHQLKAVELDPEYVSAWNGLGIVYRHLGRYDEAIQAYQKAIELDSKFAYPYANLADVYADLGRYEEAIELYQKSLDLEPRAKPWNGLGIVYRHLGRHDEAIQAYQRAIELDPKEAIYHNNLADVYLELGELDKAEAEFQERVRLGPKDALRAYVALGAIAWHQGDIQTGQQQFARALETWETALERRLQSMSALLANKAVALLALGHKGEALQALREALAQLLPSEKPKDLATDFKLLAQSPQPPEGVEEALRMLESPKH